MALLGRNAVRTHGAGVGAVLVRQLRSPLLMLLAVTALASFFAGQRTDAVIIGVILAASVGLAFLNEYRAERAAQDLHDEIRHRVVALRDGAPTSVDVVDLVPGDVVDLRMGQAVPADIRIIAASILECDESVITGESLPAVKRVEPTVAGAGLAELPSCALMGTVVSAGTGRGVVVATGGHTEFGRIALGLGERQPDTEFQVGLRQFSMLLVKVAAALTAGIFVVNMVLDRPFIDALLFSLAIAVGITPQLLPAVVSVSLAHGSRQLAKQQVLVKRLVCIEDLGDIEVLFTDKTGTLTEGRLTFERALDSSGAPSMLPAVLGLVCSDAELAGSTVVGGNALDVALWKSSLAPRDAALAYARLATLPFDHDRRLMSVLARSGDGSAVLVVKGAPEAVLDRCTNVPDQALQALQAEVGAGRRVVAVGTRPGAVASALRPEDEAGLTLRGFLVFLDPPKESVGAALALLERLGVDVKLITGDHPAVAARVFADLGLEIGEVLTGPDLESMDDDELARRLTTTEVFARVNPEQKARIVRAQRRTGLDVAFLGDGVNDALALHAADVGISVDSATDVAKDAADVVLLEKDLHVLASGVIEGRRIFANTIKYVLMGTSSNFGNMFSAAGASVFLPFLPMLPSQILLNNLLYDTSQLAIPTDHVDPEQLDRPARWDIGLIRRFMLAFGPISSLFDFATFGVMLWVFDAGETLFHTGWFVESLATQTLVIFVIRTWRSPFTRSRPSAALLTAALGVVTLGAVLPVTPLAGSLGFAPLPTGFFLALVVMVLIYLLLVEIGKVWFFRALRPQPAERVRAPGHRIQRRASRFTTSVPTGRALPRRDLRGRGTIAPVGHARRQHGVRTRKPR